MHSCDIANFQKRRYKMAAAFLFNWNRITLISTQYAACSLHVIVKMWSQRHTQLLTLSPGCDPLTLHWKNQKSQIQVHFIKCNNLSNYYSRRSCTTSRAWKCRETWRGSWSRSCSQTQTTPLCWQAGATLLEVCSSRCPSALPLTWSRLSPAHIRLRVARWPSTCPRSRPPHASGQARSDVVNTFKRWWLLSSTGFSFPEFASGRM